MKKTQDLEFRYEDDKFEIGVSDIVVYIVSELYFVGLSGSNKNSYVKALKKNLPSGKSHIHLYDIKNLPKPLKWRSFLNNDLILLTDISLKVQKAYIKYDLNKAKI